MTDTGSNSNNNDLILNYHDACVYQSDLDILKAPDEWLSDACINFFLMRISQSLGDERLKFVDPSVLSFFMHQWDEEEDGDEDVLGLIPKQGSKKKRIVFLPINDDYVSESWAIPGGGSHWSLLLLVVSTSDDFKSSFYHLDSSPGLNDDAARAVAEKIHHVLSMWKKKKKKGAEENESPINLHDKLIIQECSVPSQENAYDCGIHTLAAAEALGIALSTVDGFVEEKDPKELYARERLEAEVKRTVESSPSFCAELRQRIANDVESLASSLNKRKEPKLE